ncbi:MAG: TRAP transporter large permease subunit [bacterium]|nr:TRAP transporter large permease subunit [bacterium]
MTIEIGLLFGLLAVMVYLFLTEKIPVDLTAFLGLAVLILAGYLTPDEAFTGFASTAVITMLSIFIVGGALLRTGVADVIGAWAHRLVGGNERLLVVTLMLVAGGMSAFMNNIAAVAVMMPAVSSIARRSGIAPSRLFMPLSFGAILGGTTTLVGTPPNIVVGALMQERNLEPFSLFDFTPIGLVLLLAGVVFMSTIGRRLLPVRRKDVGAASARELVQSYHLQDRLFTIRVPHGSHLAGRTLLEAQFGPTLSIEVLTIRRGERRIYAPDHTTVLRGDDVLLVKGKRSLLEELRGMRGIEVRPTSARELPGLTRGVSGVRAAVTKDSPAVGKTLREIRFRDRYELIVVGIVRDGRLQSENLAAGPLEPGDELIAIGASTTLDRFGHEAGFVVAETGFKALEPLQDKLFVVQIEPPSPMIGSTIGETRIGQRVGLTVGGLIRDGVTHLGVAPTEELRAGDGLVVAGEPWRLLGLVELGGSAVDDALPDTLDESSDTGVVEVAVAPRSKLAGRTLQDLQFRSKYGMQVLSIWSAGQSYRIDLTHRRLAFGDALLLQGPWGRVEQLARDSDFVVLSQHVETPRRTSKAPFALGGLLLMIAMVVSGYQPIHVAAFTAASVTVLSGALRMEEAYRVIEWRVIFLVAAVLPVGFAMERTGAALLLAEVVAEVAGPLGPHAILAALVLLASMLSQGLDGAPAVVLLAPVVQGIASGLGIDPRPLMMGVGVAASAAFMTPFSHKANMLVMGAGAYRSMDYVRVGTLLTVVVLVLITITVPLFFPF